jgi:uncharacterized protein YgbK (DUF1537 family)
LGADTSIAQIAMVPLQNNHDEQGVIQSDRVLMVSGSLVDTTHGNVSTALYDGKNMIPYIVASTASGSSGYVSSLFRSVANFSFDQRSEFPGRLLMNICLPPDQNSSLLESSS